VAAVIVIVAVASASDCDILPSVSDEIEPTTEITRNASGIIKSKGSYLAGEMHGDWAFYRLDGSVMRAGRFERGRQVGSWRTFDREGRMVKQTDFGDGD